MGTYLLYVCVLHSWLLSAYHLACVFPYCQSYRRVHLTTNWSGMRRKLSTGPYLRTCSLSTCTAYGTPARLAPACLLPTHVCGHMSVCLLWPPAGIHSISVVGVHICCGVRYKSYHGSWVGVKFACYFRDHAEGYRPPSTMLVLYFFKGLSQVKSLHERWCNRTNIDSSRLICGAMLRHFSDSAYGVCKICFGHLLTCVIWGESLHQAAAVSQEGYPCFGNWRC